MFAIIANKIAKYLKDNNTIDDEHYEICRYGLQQGFMVILNFASTIVLGLGFGVFWQALLFTLLFIPLRSNAGGYHAKTAGRCYVYSILLMSTILLAIKHITLSSFICIITLMFSITIICILAPVEDNNKPLEKIELRVYKNRTLLITVIESILLIISLSLRWMQIAYCVTWTFIMVSAILFAGKCKNKKTAKSNVL